MICRFVYHVMYHDCPRAMPLVQAKHGHQCVETPRVPRDLGEVNKEVKFPVMQCIFCFFCALHTSVNVCSDILSTPSFLVYTNNLENVIAMGAQFLLYVPSDYD